MIQTLFFLVIIGVALYFVEKYVPMSAPVKTIFRVIVVLMLLFWFLSLFGLVSVPASLRAR